MKVCYAKIVLLALALPLYTAKAVSISQAQEHTQDKSVKSAVAQVSTQASSQVTTQTLNENKQDASPATQKAVSNKKRSAGLEDLVARVLLKAEMAFNRQQYTQPKHNNAFDRFTAVLMVDGDNARAKKGLIRVRDAYLAMADAELNAGNIDKAKVFLRILREHYSSDGAVMALAQHIRKQQPAVATEEIDVNDLTRTRFRLASSSLTARNGAVKSMLENIAKRLVQTHETVLIVARNDAEGRWIYQTMNKSTPSYRVRGDIRIGSKPEITLQEPL